MRALFPRESIIAGHQPGSSRYNSEMTLAVFRATVWLGAKLSFVAAALAVVLSAIGDVSRWSLVIAVAVLAFAASWVQTGRVERGQSPLLVVRTVQRSG